MRQILITTAIILDFIYIADPQDKSWGIDKIAFLKYLPIFLCFLSFRPSLLSATSLFRKYFLSFLFILFFFTLVVAKSLTSMSNGLAVEDCYLGLGISILSFFAFYEYFRTASFKQCGMTLNIIYYLTLLIGFFIFLLSCYWRFVGPFLDAPHIYHEQIFIPCLGAAAIIMGRTISTFRILLFLCLISTSIISWKLTGFITGYVTFLFVMLFFFNKIRKKNRMLSIAIISPIISLGTIATGYIIFAFNNYRSILPSGHTSERVTIYLLRFNQFLESWLFGNFFYGYKHVEYGSVPRVRHSDLLDFLAMGGAFGFILFIVPFLNSVIIGMKNMNIPNSKGIHFNAIFLLCLILLFLELTVNPILHQPKLAFFYWLSLAYILNLHKFTPSAGKLSRDVSY